MDPKVIVQKYNQKVLDDYESIYHIEEITVNGKYQCRQRVKDKEPEDAEYYDNYLKKELKKMSVDKFKALIKERNLFLLNVDTELYTNPDPLTTHREFNEMFKQDLHTDNLHLRLFKINMLLNHVKDSLKSQSTWHQQMCDYMANIMESPIDDSIELFNLGENQLFVDAIILEYIKCYQNLRIVICLEDALEDDDSKAELLVDQQSGMISGCKKLYSKDFTLTSNGVRNLFYFLKAEDSVPDCLKMTNQVHVILVEQGETEFEYDNCCIMETHMETVDVAKIVFHQSTLEYVNKLQRQVFNKSVMLLNSFKEWLCQQMPDVLDHDRFLIAGGCVKAVNGIRESSDLDFFVSDITDKIEDNPTLRYTPNTVSRGAFDDFGKTYYAVEDYYFPARNELYKMQSKFKMNRRIERPKNKTILDIVPPFSVSGLKAGRYLNFFKQMVHSYSDSTTFASLDDLVFDPRYHIYFNGVKVMRLEYEIVRDHMRCLDLDRVSTKQILDFCEINRIYRDDKRFQGLGIDMYRHNNKELVPKLYHSVDINLFHSETPFMNEDGDKIGEKVLIRKTPLVLNESLEKHPFLSIKVEEKEVATFEIIRGKQYVVWHMFSKSVNQRIYENVLITSLPLKIGVAYNHVTYDSNWNYILTNKGKVNVALVTNCLEYGSRHETLAQTTLAYGEEVVCGGQIYVEQISDTTIRIRFNVQSRFTDECLSMIKEENRRRYEMKLVNYMRTIINMHKLYDVLHTMHLSIDVSKDRFDYKGLPMIQKKEPVCKEHIFTSDDREKMQTMKENMEIPYSMFLETYRGHVMK